jgi:thiol-disulfide isomerase/thioredoxin
MIALAEPPPSAIAGVPPPAPPPPTAAARPANSFLPLSGPAAYDCLFNNAEPQTITVVKFVAQGCRACRAATPKLAAIAKRWPDARFYSMELTRDADDMLAFFQARNITLMPFVEVYVGASRVDSIIVTPSRTNFVVNALAAARATQAAAARRAFRKRLVSKMRRNHKRLRALHRLRAAHVDEWRAAAPLRSCAGESSLAEDSRAQRRAHLVRLLQLRDERDEVRRPPAPLPTAHSPPPAHPRADPSSIPRRPS